MKGDGADPLKSLETIRAALRNVRRHMFYSSGPVYRIWAAAWLLSFASVHAAEYGVFGWALPGAAVGWVWAVLMGGAGTYTFVYYRRHPIDADYRRWFGMAWVGAFALMAFTVWSRTAMGLPLDAIDFVVFGVHTVSVIYLVTGAVLLDGVQTGVGAWLGVANLIGLLLGPAAYPLAAGALIGAGLFVAGAMEDRIRRRVAGEER